MYIKLKRIYEVGSFHVSSIKNLDSITDKQADQSGAITEYSTVANTNIQKLLTFFYEICGGLPVAEPPPVATARVSHS